ncbi:EpsG family protein [Virgibacillus sp. AGTR]|uniref:EpsG family protein n=1 Tax=Virgibacillus sp. AGTR TaxID=2812055 RepID=UPI001963E530|nr:EpsG family protein [Virgibacillus sp. AGTR]MCC2251535.1 EpsG family protein [Virgibacillus sp. AGTR]QRZ18967.1 EpsG family protein [Virgibacillus sp. AGTR]
MALLWFNLILVFSFSFLARYVATPITVPGVVDAVRPNKLFVFASLVSLVVISGLRSNIGDTFFYKYSYELNNFTWDTVIAQKDIGFGLLQMLLKNFISEYPQILIFTTALITNVFIIFVLYHYSRMLELSLYVYITGGLFLVSMNGIRQVLAAAIAFTAIKYVTEGSFIKYALIICLASLFHQSALILLPIYFLVRFKAWSKATLVLITVSLVIVVGFEQFSALLFSALEDTQYGHYKGFEEGGSNILRVAVGAVPLFIAFLGRNKLRELTPNSDYIVNMSLLGFIFMLISTQNWIFARISIYFELYQLILISWIVKLFREKDQKFIYFGILICYFAYYYYENVISLQILYESDYLVWNTKGGEK